MTALALFIALLVAPPLPGLSGGEFQSLGRQWIYETVAEPTRSCLTSEDRARMIVQLNDRGEVAVVVRSTSSASVRACLEHIAQPSRHFAKDAAMAELMITFPEPHDPQESIVDEVPPRPARESGMVCSRHDECGAGQFCIGPDVVADGGRAAQRRCLDLQRWLAARAR